MTAFRREDLLRALPYARRYARALCGGQERGDALVTEAVRTLLAAVPRRARPARPLPGDHDAGRSTQAVGQPGDGALSQTSGGCCC